MDQVDEHFLWNEAGEDSVVRSMRCSRCEICYPLAQKQPRTSWCRQSGRLNDDRPGYPVSMRYESCLVCGGTTSSDGEPPIPMEELVELEMNAAQARMGAFERDVLADIAALPDA